MNALPTTQLPINADDRQDILIGICARCGVPSHHHMCDACMPGAPTAPAFCHCVRCQQVYAFEEWMPLYCPTCMISREQADTLRLAQHTTTDSRGYYQRAICASIAALIYHEEAQRTEDSTLHNYANYMRGMAIGWLLSA